MIVFLLFCSIPPRTMSSAAPTTCRGTAGLLSLRHETVIRVSTVFRGTLFGIVFKNGQIGRRKAKKTHGCGLGYPQHGLPWKMETRLKPASTSWWIEFDPYPQFGPAAQPAFHRPRLWMRRWLRISSPTGPCGFLCRRQALTGAGRGAVGVNLGSSSGER